ncbi:MAG: hypothetical protein WBV06_17015 [Acidimicrobiia bacterium]
MQLVISSGLAAAAAAAAAAAVVIVARRRQPSPSSNRSRISDSVALAMRVGMLVGMLVGLAVWYWTKKPDLGILVMATGVTIGSGIARRRAR